LGYRLVVSLFLIRNSNVELIDLEWLFRNLTYNNLCGFFALIVIPKGSNLPYLISYYLSIGTRCLELPLTIAGALSWWSWYTAKTSIRIYQPGAPLDANSIKIEMLTTYSRTLRSNLGSLCDRYSYLVDFILSLCSLLIIIFRLITF